MSSVVDKDTEAGPEGDAT